VGRADGVRDGVAALDVLAAVQRYRAKARDAGALASNEYVNVVPQSPTVIVIEPVQPEIVYVPVYDPWLLYRPGWAYRPGFRSSRSGWGYRFGSSGVWAWDDIAWGPSYSCDLRLFESVVVEPLASPGRLLGPPIGRGSGARPPDAISYGSRRLAACERRPGASVDAAMVVGTPTSRTTGAATATLSWNQRDRDPASARGECGRTLASERRRARAPVSRT